MGSGRLHIPTGESTVLSKEEGLRPVTPSGVLTPQTGEEQNPAIAVVLGTRAINTEMKRRKRERDLALD